MTATRPSTMMRALAALVSGNVPVLVWGSPGAGKALDVNTPIPTPGGWATMGSLRTGDLVFDDNGSPCTVTGVFPQPAGRECFEVLFDDRSTIVADAEHLWTTETRTDRTRPTSSHQTRGDDTARRCVSDVVLVDGPEFTTISELARELPTVAPAAIRDAAHQSGTVHPSGTARTYLATDVRAATTLDVPDQAFVNSSDLIALGATKRRVQWSLRKVQPIAGRGDMYLRANVLKALQSLLTVESYKQHDGRQAVVTTAMIRDSLHTDGSNRTNHSIPVNGGLRLPARALPIAPYTLGAWLGDGNTDGARITTMDDEVLTAVRGDGYVLTAHESSSSGQATTYGISLRDGDSVKGARSFRGALTSLGVRGNKHIPVEYQRASREQRFALLQGLMDTDGTAAKSGSASFTVTLEHLAHDVFELVVGLGYKVHLSSQPCPGGRPGRQTAWTVRFTTSDPVFRVARKGVRLHQVTRATNGRRFIVDVRPVPSRDVTCISVDSASHLFLAGAAMIPTHNTAKLEAHGTAWGRHVETISAGSREAVDFMGLPMESNGEVVYSPLAWAKRLGAADKGLLVVDEVTTAQSTFKAFLRILQERYVGEYKLPDTVAIIGIANPPEIAVDGVDLPAPVANRFCHLQWHLDRTEWLANVGTNFTQVDVPSPSTYLTDGAPADRARAVNIITGFLQFRPDLILKVPDDPESQSGAWPSPRSWTNAMDSLTWVPADDDDARDMILRGCVGEAALHELLSWLAMSDLHDPAAVLENPGIVAWATERPDRVFALLNAVVTIAILEGDAGTWRKALAVTVACANAGRPDVAMPAARTLANADHARDGVPAAFKEAFSDLFTRTGQIQAVA